MYVIYYHNKREYDNPSECEIYGPLADLFWAKAYLVKLVEAADDELFKINADGTYASYDKDDLIGAGREIDPATEIWAEVVRLTSP